MKPVLSVNTKSELIRYRNLATLNTT
uniref:Uncharacterized protein n=1 Tax=Arundo donax TaxID=35708 RepID=A0A0A9HUL0_ARUDO